jgi:ParB/RepB/Spo0J family partition protein
MEAKAEYQTERAIPECHIGLIPLDKIEPNPNQPRKEFDEDELRSLAASIKERGVRNAISVRDVGSPNSEHYYILDGERRWRAAKMAGLDVIPATIDRSGIFTEAENIEVALMCNLQRADMSPIEEAIAYRELHDKYGYKIEKIAKTAGKSIPTIQSRLKLTYFEPEVQALFVKGGLPTDYPTVSLMLSLPSEMRVKMLRGLFKRHATGASVRRVCNIALSSLNNTRLPETPIRSRKASSRVISFTEEPNFKILKVLERTNELPKWDLIEEAAKEACERCDLNESPSDLVCKECPAVCMVRALVKKMNKQE